MTIKFNKSYILSIIFLLICFIIIFLQVDLVKVKFFTIKSFLLSIVFGAVSFSISGLKQYFVMKHNLDIKLKVSDVLFLPIAMNFWSFIIPFKGGMLYNIFLLRNKYCTSYTNIFSFNLIIYSLTIVISGCIGIFLSLYYDFFSLLIIVTCTLFIFNPLIVLTIYKIFHRSKLIDNKIISKIFVISGQLVKSYSIYKVVLSVFSITILHILFQIFWFFYINELLELQMNFFEVSFIVIIRQILVVFKFTPGGLGFNELVSGGITEILINDPTLGILLTFYIRLSTLTLSSFVGPVFTIRNKKYYKFSSIKKIKLQLLKLKQN